jgi:hypothetical protein
MRGKIITMINVSTVSMMKPSAFDSINEMAQKVRDNTRPFGGIQVSILTSRLDKVFL